MIDDMPLFLHNKLMYLANDKHGNGLNW